MRKYLHTSVTEIITVVEYIDKKQSESEQLDFKAQPWGKGKDLELCKDVAAFANHLGGDIIIGVEDKGDCANGFCPILETDISTIIKTIQQGLLNHLRPHTISQSIEYTTLASIHPGQSILVISIPPSIDLVGIEERTSDVFNYRFPIRNGRRNQFLPYEEIMTKLSSTARLTYIRLKELASSGDKIRFSNPVYVEMHDQLCTIHTPNRIHGTLEDYTPDVVKVSMQQSFQYKYKTGFTYAQSSGQIHGEKLLTIPLDLIKAIWKDNSGDTLLHVALDAKVISYGGIPWTIVYD